MLVSRLLKCAAVAICGLALAVQWCVVGERMVAAIWGWYKFLGYGGAEPLVVGREAQGLFYLLTVSFAAVALSVARSGVESQYAKVARWEFRGLLAAAAVWTAVLMSPLVAPLGNWR